MLGGGGNVDHFTTPGYEGFSLRLYDPDEGTCGGSGGPPRRARAASTRRSRAASPTAARASSARTCSRGVPIRVRFDWSEMTGDSALWEQWFSFDGGETWKLNWVMRLTRAT